VTALHVIFALAAFGLVAWFLTVGVFWIVKGAGRATGLDRKVDQFLDAGDAALSPQERAKSMSNHPGVGGQADPGGCGSSRWLLGDDRRTTPPLRPCRLTLTARPA